MDPKALKEQLAADSRRLGVIARRIEKIDAERLALIQERESIERRWKGTGGADA